MNECCTGIEFISCVRSGVAGLLRVDREWRRDGL
jgi:hypothetical protein